MMAGFSFTYLFYLAIFFNCKTSSEDCVPPFCRDSLDSCQGPDSEWTPCSTVDSEAKCDENTATKSLLEDSTSSCENPLTEIPEEILTQTPEQKDSSTTDDRKNEDTVQVEKPKTGSFNADPKTIIFLVVCAILALPFIDAVYRCLFHRNRDTSETESNGSFISSDIPERPYIPIRIVIATGINRVGNFLIHPFRTLAEQIREPVNVSTIEVVELSSLNSETESPPKRDEIPDSSDRDANDDQDDDTSSNSINPYMSMMASNSSDSVPTSSNSCQETQDI